MKNSNILASENFSCGNKHYFLDFRIAKNNSNYICITRSDSQPDDTYTKQCVRVFEEDFHILIGCMSSLFRSAAYHGEQDVRVQDLYRTNKDRPQDDFCGFAGMGVAKSSSILTAMELAKRMYSMLNVSPVRKMCVGVGAIIRPALG